MTMLKRSGLVIVILSLALISVVSSAHADTWKEAMEAFGRKQYGKWGRLAAKQGHTDAQVLLGSLYYTKEGNESPDVIKAYMWYEVAAAQGNPEAQKEVATITKELSPQQLAEAQAKAQQCKSSNYEKCDGD